MEKNIMENVYLDYNEKIHIDGDMIIISLWNKIVELKGEGCKVFPNDRDFFEEEFENAYDAAWAASAGDYRWTDEFVYISNEGHLISFSRLDDGSCPIDLDKIDISSLIQELQEVVNKKSKGEVVNNISPAIQEALQEV